MQHGLYIEDVASGTIRFTRPGIALLAQRFASLGIDIRSVCTRARLEEIIDVLYDTELRRLAQNARSLYPELDRILATVPVSE